MAATWLLLVYRILPEPTAGRVCVWRKLKQLGAVALQDAVWVLPRTARTVEQFHKLAAEITELPGEAMLRHSEPVYATDCDALRQKFIEPILSEYRRTVRHNQLLSRSPSPPDPGYHHKRPSPFFSRGLS